MNTHSSKKILLWIHAMILSISIQAQDVDPGPPPVDPDGGPGDNPDQEVPFDGGIILLLAAGAAYGAKKSINYRKGMKQKINTIS